jgi:phage baseplate assembly protein W
VELAEMPDISPFLIRVCMGAPSQASSCSQCHRTPLAGERIHRIESGSLLCELCFAALPEEQRVAVRSDRVRASERALSVVPRAA